MSVSGIFRFGLSMPKYAVCIMKQKEKQFMSEIRIISYIFYFLLITEYSVQWFEHSGFL
jgi:hypothetical protein